MQLCVRCRVLNSPSRKSYIAKTIHEHRHSPRYKLPTTEVSGRMRPSEAASNVNGFNSPLTYASLNKCLSLLFLWLSLMLQVADTIGLILLPRCCEISSFSTLAFGTAAETPSCSMGPCARAVAAESCLSFSLAVDLFAKQASWISAMYDSDIRHSAV